MSKKLYTVEVKQKARLLVRAYEKGAVKEGDMEIIGMIESDDQENKYGKIVKVAKEDYDDMLDAAVPVEEEDVEEPEVSEELPKKKK